MSTTATQRLWAALGHVDFDPNALVQVKASDLLGVLRENNAHVATITRVRAALHQHHTTQGERA